MEPVIIELTSAGYDQPIFINANNIATFRDVHAGAEILLLGQNDQCIVKESSAEIRRRIENAVSGRSVK